MNSWFSKFISLDEMKSSSLIISFLVFSGVALYMLITKGEIPQNLTTLLTIQIGVIGGVNAVNFVSNNMAMSKNAQMMPYQNNMYGTSNMYGMNNAYGMNQMNGVGMNTTGMGTQTTPVSTPVQTQPVTANPNAPQNRPI